MSQELDLTLGELVDQTAKARPEARVMSDLIAGRSLTWSEFSLTTDRLAKAFMALGLEKGDRMALWGGSTLTWVLVQYAAAKAGLIIVSADPDYDYDQIHYLLEQSESVALFTIGGYKDLDYPAMIRDICPEVDDDPEGVCHTPRLPLLRQLIYYGPETWEGFLGWGRLMELADTVSETEFQDRKASVRPLDTALISYTSGTTGAPKGVMCTHHGLINKAFLSARILKLGPDDRAGLCVPLYHMFGNTCVVLTAFSVGAEVLFLGPHFEVDRALEGLARGEATVVMGAPSQFIAMLEHPNRPRLNLSALRGGIMGGAPCPMEVMKKVVEDMGLKDILVGYGQTEASSWVTLTRPDDPLETRVSTIGRALPNTEVKIVDPKSGEEVPAGEPGEMCTRGYLMAGYYNMPAATAQAVDAEGWLHTGDLVALDDRGNGRVLGRIKDIIAKDGREISPVDVEEALFAHPAILEAAVFGLPSESSPAGELVAAWIKPKPGQNPSREEVLDFCRTRLPGPAVPDLIRFTDSFPMTATGKIQKFKMREITAREMNQGEK